MTAIPGWSTESPEYKRIEGYMLGWWEAFKAAADIDDDGHVTLEEVNAVLAQTRPQVFEATASRLFDILDTDGDGAIRPEEYRKYEAALFTNNPDPDETFAILDENGDGLISREEVVTLLVEYHTADDPNARGNRLFGFRC